MLAASAPPCFPHDTWPHNEPSTVERLMTKALVKRSTSIALGSTCKDSVGVEHDVEAWCLEKTIFSTYDLKKVLFNFVKASYSTILGINGISLLPSVLMVLERPRSLRNVKVSKAHTSKDTRSGPKPFGSRARFPPFALSISPPLSAALTAAKFFGLGLYITVAGNEIRTTRNHYIL